LGYFIFYTDSGDNKSGTMIASYIEKPIAVYKDNMEETVIKDGFHSRDDIYRNVPIAK
jgi:D-xylose transport system substrate-binding protein